MAQRIRVNHLQLVVLIGKVALCLYGKVCLSDLQRVFTAVGHHQPEQGGVGLFIVFHPVQRGDDLQHRVAGAGSVLHRGIPGAAGQQAAARHSHSGEGGIFQERAAGKFPSHIRSSFGTHQYRFCHRALPIQ